VPQIEVVDDPLSVVGVCAHQTQPKTRDAHRPFISGATRHPIRAM